MAKKKVENKDIAGNDLFTGIKDRALSLLSVLDKIDDKLKDILKTHLALSKNNPYEGYKDIQKAEKGIRDVEKASEELTKNEKTRIKLRERLNDLNSEGAQANADLREQIRRVNKEQRDNAKSALDQSDAYKLLEKRTKAAQIELKRLLATEGELSEETKEARKEFEKLADELEKIDKLARDGRKQVGQYERQLSKVSRTLKTIGATAIVGLLLKLGDVFSSTSTGADTLEKTLGRVTITLREFTVSLINSFKNLDTQGLSAFSNAFGGITERIDSAINSLDVAVDATRAFRKATAQAADAIAILTKQQEILEGTSDDTTLSLDDQEEALRNLEDATRDLFKIEEELAKQQVQVAQARFNSNRDSIEAQEALAEATSNLINIQFGQLQSEAEIFRRRREIISDQSELVLDILIDAADNQKTINERIISDERVNLKTRRELLKQTEQFLKQSFDAQITEIVRAQTFIRGERFSQLKNEIDILLTRKEFLKKNGEDVTDIENEITKKVNKAKELQTLFTIDANKLLQESDFELLNEQVKNLGLSEALQIRLLDAIKERKTATQDLTDSNKDLTESEREFNEVSADIALQLETLEAIRRKRIFFNKELKELEEARSKQQIENITERLKNVEEGSAEELKLRQELFNALLDQEQKQGEKLIAQRVKLQEAASTVINAFGEKLFENELNRLDKELEAVKSRSNELRALAANNVESATENLAFQQKREAEIEREREKKRKEQEKSKLVLTLLDTASAKAAAGDENAILNTIFDANVLKAFAQTFPSFYEGTESLGKASKPLDNNGGRIILAHDGERIMPKALNESLNGTPSNEALATTYNLGKAMMSQVQTVSTTSQNTYDNRVIDRLDRVEKAISSKPVFTGFNYDQLGKVVSDIINQGNKTVINHRRVRKH